MIRLVCLALSLSVLSLRAQTKEDKVAIQSVIDQFFTAMFSGDTTRLAGLMEPGAVLTTVSSTVTGGNTITHSSRQIFFRSIRTMNPDLGLNECLTDWDFFIDPQGATVVCPYHFFVKHNYSHSGTDTFVLRRTASGWKIVSVSDTRFTLSRPPKRECE